MSTGVVIWWLVMMARFTRNKKGKMGYAIEHEGKQFTPEGIVTEDGRTTEERNRETERKEIEWLRTGPERVFLYVSENPWRITTWLGTRVSTQESIGPKVYVGFGHNTYRRAVRCQIFGVLYHGWYMESSGSYCRLKRAKKQ